MCSLQERAIEAAVQVWKGGFHAVAGTRKAQAAVRKTEERAWQLGNVIPSARGTFDSRSSLDSDLHGLQTSDTWHSVSTISASCETSKSSRRLAEHRSMCVTPAGE